MALPLCEVRVFSRRHRFAGTLDVLGTWRGAGALLDYKTGAPRDVAADLQTAAYLGALLEMIETNDRSDMLVFDEDRHRYTLDGIELPSVTQVLQASGLMDFSKVSPTDLVEARDRGTAVHRACHYYNEDDLVPEAFEASFPEYWPYLAAWITFRRDSGFQLATRLADIPSWSHVKRYAIRLKPDGRCAVECHTEARDYREFLALNTALQIRERRRGSWLHITDENRSASCPRVAD